MGVCRFGQGCLYIICYTTRGSAQLPLCCEIRLVADPLGAVCFPSSETIASARPFPSSLAQGCFLFYIAGALTAVSDEQISLSEAVTILTGYRHGRLPCLAQVRVCSKCLPCNYPSWRGARVSHVPSTCPIRVLTCLRVWYRCMPSSR